MKKSKKKKSNKSEPQIISYLTIRRAVGILGISLPVVLVVGSVVGSDCKEIQSSISSYYYTDLRDVFIGFVCAIALFLFAYRGYEYKDRIAGKLACFSALGVAFFPTSITEPLTHCIPESVDRGMISSMHFISAGLFFITLAYFSLVLFTKGEKKPTEKKLKRNLLYSICGFTILGSLFLIVVYSALLKKGIPVLQNYDPIFWLEAIALWAFGISWLIKGKALMADN